MVSNATIYGVPIYGTLPRITRGQLEALKAAGYRVVRSLPANSTGDEFVRLQIPTERTTP